VASWKRTSILVGRKCTANIGQIKVDRPGVGLKLTFAPLPGRLGGRSSWDRKRQRPVCRASTRFSVAIDRNCLGGLGVQRIDGLRAARAHGFWALVALCCFGPATVAAAAPADTVYTVANYPVEASDKNAVAAKDKALADGQKAAFRSLLKRIVPVTAYKQISRLSNVQAGNLVSGVAVRSERNSATDYIASLDFSFQPDAVRAELQREGIPFVDVQAGAVTIVPVMRQGNPAEAKSDKGPWRTAWNGLDLAHTLTPVKIEDLKAEIHSDTVSMLADGDDNGLRILATEYKSDRVVVAIFEPDLTAKKVVVTLAGQDAVGPLHLKRTYRISDGDLGYTSELAAVVALGVLEGRWKAVKAAAQANSQISTAAQPPAWSAAGAATSSGAGEPMTLVAEFNSLAQWNDIRTQLLDTPGVDDVAITTMSARSADVALRFPGGAKALANAVGGRGLILENVGTGWVLRPNF
jgi:Uncharacterized protein conserved in bacteria (DUF2066)